MATALLVARPLAPGEDPGMLGDDPSAAGLLLTTLWLAAAASWAGWRVWDRRASWYAGAPDLFLAAAVAVVATSAAVAPYKHPAWLIAGEWLGLLTAFCVVRQLAVSPCEQHGLCTALLATAVALAAEALFRCLAPAVPSLAFDRSAVSAFTHPGSLAAVLALWLPPLAAAVALTVRQGASGWQTGPCAAAAVATGAALLLTGSRAAVAAVLLVGLGAAVVGGWLRSRRSMVLAIFAAGVAVAAAYAGGWAAGEAARAREEAAGLGQVWSTTVRMMEDGAGWGVGPGNFGRTYLRHMDASAPDVPEEPHDFALELWAAAGPLALVAVLAVLVVFFVRVFRPGREWTLSEESRPAEDGPPGCETGGVRWEFYLGGMLGLTLGFGLHLGGGRGSEQVLAEGLAAAVRSLAWFAAFGVLDRVAWTGRLLARALAAGVAAFLLTETVTAGFGYPSVACGLWAAVALGLNAAGDAPSRRLSAGAAARYLAFPVLAGCAALFGLVVTLPVTGAAVQLARARAAARALDAGAAADPDAFIAPSVLVPLKEAARSDRDDARVWAELARWYRRRWELNADADDPKKDKPRTAQPLGAPAVKSAQAAEGLDPAGPEGYEANYEMFRRFGAYSAARAEQAKKKGDKKAEDHHRKSALEQYKVAARAVASYLPHDPTNARLRYRLAEAAFRAGDKALGSTQAAEAERLDALATNPARRLTDAERQQVRQWRTARPAD